MKAIQLSRQKGKTTEAIKIANETGAYLICLDHDEARRIREECNRNPVSFSELNTHGMKGSFVRNVVVDNFDVYFERRLTEALRDVLAPLDGLRVEAITFTEDPQEIIARLGREILTKCLRQDLYGKFQ